MNTREELIEKLRVEARRMAVMETGTLAAIKLMKEAADLLWLDIEGW